MAWMVIRKATQEDETRYSRTAATFLEKYGEEGPYVEDPRLKDIWRKRVERALGKGSQGIAWDCVGYSVDE